MSETQCYFCKVETSSYAGDPGLWPIHFCHAENPGVPRVHCTGCVSDLAAKLTALEAERNEANRVRDDNIRIAVAYVDAFSQVEHERDEAKKELLFALADRKVLVEEVKAARKTLTKDGNLIIKFGDQTFNDKLEYSLARQAVDTAKILERTGE